MQKNPEPMPPRRLALYGGAFDPVHVAHLTVARRSLEVAALDAVVFLPAAQSPLKAHSPLASDAERIEMLRLATAGEPGFRVDDYEIRKGGTSFSVATVAHYRSRYPEATLFWILGGDQFAQLDKWHQAEMLAAEVCFLVIARPGSATTPPPVAGLRYQRVDAPMMEESSSGIRERCRQGRPLKGSVPPSVEAFISRAGLYKS